MSRVRISALLLAPLLALAGTLVAATPAHAAGALAPPGAPTITQLTAVSAVVQWTPSPSPNIEYYYVETLVNGQWTFLTDTGLITPLTTSVYVPLQPATTYTFAVQAWDTNGNSSPLGPATTFRTPPRDTALTCAASFSAIVWSTGFYVTGQVKNTSSAIVNGWVVRFAIPGDQQITNGFNGTFTQVGHDVTVVNTAFNGRIDAYGQVNLGYYGTSTSGFTKPTAYTLNGVGCEGQ